jgi:predicted metal-dependent phosphoesterase TrpH
VTRARVLALLAVITGIGLGGLGGDVPPRVHASFGGYTILAADFHVHSFPDGIPVWDAAAEARRRRLDVIALTSHNSMLGWWMWTHAPWLSADARHVMALPGEELTSAGYHMAIVGLSKTIAWRRTIVDAVAAAHAQGAVAILAHPSGAAFRRVITDEGLRAVDGIEASHPQMESSQDARRDFPEYFARAMALKPGTAAIGSSDFHYFAPIGLSRTYVFVREVTPAGVLEALRAARSVACDMRGETHGPPALAAAVAGRCDDVTADPEGATPVSAAGTVLAWVGLLALVLLGPSGR